ncbi:TPA: glycosyltransferase [Candidatus Poribacteria bacterium]|nr:glycosyltransferase [Candidatus Poribacteria bacterium]
MSYHDIKIHWQLHFYDPSSMSASARDTALAMAEIGCQVKVSPLDASRKSGVIPPEEEAKLKLLQSTKIKEEDCYHVKFSPEDALAEPKPGKNIAKRIWSYDLNSVPHSKVQAINHQFDALWTCSQHCLNAFINVGLYKEKGYVVPRGIEKNKFNLNAPPKELPTKKKWKFLFVGLPIVRKGLETLLEAYMEEFSAKEDVCLIVMTRSWNKEYVAKCDEEAKKSAKRNDYPEVIYIQEDLPQYEMPSYYTACDCYIHPAYAEAFGKTIIEAMACGLPVIVTRWGGPVDFCTRQNSFLLDYTFAPAYNELRGFTLPENALWAKPDKEQLRNYMRYVFEHQEVTKEMGLAAHEEITKNWTWIKAAQKAAQSIREIAISPGGVKNDSYRYDDSKVDFSWEGIWWAQGHIDELGWTAEFKIPFANFRFKDRQEHVWGINFERINRRKKETSDWKPMFQEEGGWTRMSELGHLVGLRDIEAGKQFEISLYFLSGSSSRGGFSPPSDEKHNESMNGTLGTGLDVQYSVTGTLKTNVTVNPDFAQVEADQLEINLTRFPTRFEEKRPFFVEGNSFFQTPLELFYSRRIGSRGDILWGTKMTGKVGDYSLGFIGSQTGSFDTLGFGKQVEGKEEALYSILRLKKDIFERSNIGLLLADKEMDGGYSRLGGLDASLGFHESYRVAGQLAFSFHPGQGTKNKAYRMEFGQNNDLWNATVRLERLDPLFDANETGYLRKEPHRGWQQVGFEAAYTPRIRKMGLRKAFVSYRGEVSQSLYTDEYFANWIAQNPSRRLSPEFRRDLIAWKGSVWASLSFVESLLGRMSVFYERSREVELTDIFMASGYGFFVSTDWTRRTSGGVSVRAGDFYNFARQAVEVQRRLFLFSTLRPRSNLTLEFEGSYAQSLDQKGIIDGRFFTSSLRTTYLFTRDIFLRVFAQAGRNRTFYDKIQTQQNYLVSMLLGWEYRPKSHFFVAYNEDWKTSEEELHLDDRVIVVKISYLWNF